MCAYRMVTTHQKRCTGMCSHVRLRICIVMCLFVCARALLLGILHTFGRSWSCSASKKHTLEAKLPSQPSLLWPPSRFAPIFAVPWSCLSSLVLRLAEACRQSGSVRSLFLFLLGCSPFLNGLVRSGTLRLFLLALSFDSQLRLRKQPSTKLQDLNHTYGKNTYHAERFRDCLAKVAIV